MKHLTEKQIKYRVIADTLSNYGHEYEKDGKDAILIYYDERFDIQDEIIKALEKKGLL